MALRVGDNSNVKHKPVRYNKKTRCKGEIRIMNAINFIELFKEGTKFILFDDFNDEVYSGDRRRCMAWLMKNNQYDIFPEQGGWWAEIHEGVVLIYLTKIYE